MKIPNPFKGKKHIVGKAEDKVAAEIMAESERWLEEYTKVVATAAHKAASPPAPVGFGGMHPSWRAVGSATTPVSSQLQDALQKWIDEMFAVSGNERHLFHPQIQVGGEMHDNMASATQDYRFTLDIVLKTHDHRALVGSESIDYGVSVGAGYPFPFVHTFDEFRREIIKRFPDMRERYMNPQPVRNDVGYGGLLGGGILPSLMPTIKKAVMPKPAAPTKSKEDVEMMRNYYELAKMKAKAEADLKARMDDPIRIDTLYGVGSARPNLAWDPTKDGKP